MPFLSWVACEFEQSLPRHLVCAIPVCPAADLLTDQSLSVVIASIVRLALLMVFDAKGTANVSEDLLLPWFVTVVEIGVAIIGACLPCLMPLYRKIRYGNAGSSASAGVPGSREHPSQGKKFKRSKLSSHGLSSNGDQYDRMNTNTSRDEEFGPSTHTRTVVGRGNTVGDAGSDEIPLQGINITHEVFVKSKSRRTSSVDEKHKRDPMQVV